MTIKEITKFNTGINQLGFISCIKDIIIVSSYDADFYPEVKLFNINGNYIQSYNINYQILAATWHDNQFKLLGKILFMENGRWRPGVRIIDLDGTVMKEFLGKNYTAAAFSSDNEKIVLAVHTTVEEINIIQNYSLIQYLSRNRDSITSIFYANNDELIIAITGDEMFSIWNRKTKKFGRPIRLPDVVSGCEINKKIIMVTRNGRLYDIYGNKLGLIPAWSPISAVCSWNDYLLLAHWNGMVSINKVDNL